MRFQRDVSEHQICWNRNYVVSQVVTLMLQQMFRNLVVKSSSLSHFPATRFNSCIYLTGPICIKELGRNVLHSWIIIIELLSITVNLFGKRKIPIIVWREYCVSNLSEPHGNHGTATSKGHTRVTFIYKVWRAYCKSNLRELHGNYGTATSKGHIRVTFIYCLKEYCVSNLREPHGK